MFINFMGKNKQTEKEQFKRNAKRQEQKAHDKTMENSFVVVKNIIYTDTLDNIN